MSRYAPLVRRALLLSGCAIAVSGVRGNAQERPTSRESDRRASQFEMPDTAQFRMFLQNRLVAFVVPDPRVPVVSFTAMIRGGTATDEDAGAAEMLALMLATRGPCWMAPGTFRQTLEDTAAEFRVHMTPEMTQIRLSVAADNALDGLRVFSGIVRETCIDEQGLATFRAEVARHAQDADVTDSATATFEGGMATAVSLFNQVLYGDHPYARHVTEEEARHLEVDHVEDFHDEVFVPANLTLAVSGDFDLERMAQAVDQRFADWEDRRPPFLRSAPQVDAPNTRRLHFFPVEEERAWVVVGHELPEIEARDLPAMQVMNYIVGNAHSDTGPVETMDESAIANSASGYIELNMRGPGTYTFRTSSRPEVLGQSIDVLFQEIERVRTETVSAEELRVAKAAFTDGAFPMRFENGHATALTFAEEWTRYASLENLAQYRDRIESVSARDVQRAAQRYLNPQRMQVVVLAPQRPS
jgi:zinc protease